MKKVTKNNIVRKKSWKHWEKVLRKSVQYVEGSFFLPRFDMNNWFLQINDVHGFNITYEYRNSPKERQDVCSLSLCNYNGECFIHANETSMEVG